jgi:cellulose synthase/poly-beta-1,6-N-acetylglucosamine synthase-like glycosyltransferase
MQILFWLFLFIIFYAFIGYGILVYIILRIRNSFSKKTTSFDSSFLPEVTLVIAAFNEEDFILEKIKNCEKLDYPVDKLKVLFVTDGSSDKTNEIIANHGRYEYSFQPERKGKIAAVNRVMPSVKSEITIFCDANTYLNTESIKNITRHFANPKVGCVAGEKRIFSKDTDNASGAGEGFYWKYESFLKKLDSELYTVVGAAGELFAVKTNLWESVPTNIIIEDFVVSLKIAKAGYIVKYEPDAYAQETASANVKEELKRKVRICAGGIQAIILLSPLLNFFKYTTLSFQYISHRVLRWTIIPFLLIALIPINWYLHTSIGGFYSLAFYGQIVFYFLAFIGWYLKNKAIEAKGLFIPYYFFIMNYSVIAGIIRFIKGKQSAVWEKSQRSALN